MEDIKSLLDKKDGERLSAEEFTTLVRAVVENQELSAQVADKVGYAVRIETAGTSALYLFRDEDTYKSWEESPSIDNAPLSIIQLPAGGEGSVGYLTKIETNSATEIEGSTRDIEINLKFRSQVYSPYDSTLEDTGEDATVTIQRQMEGSDSWVTVGTINSFPSSTADGPYRKISLTNYIVDGTQYLRFLARGNVSGTATTYLTFTISIAEMSAEFTTNWGNAFVYNSSIPTSANMTIPLKVTGTVHKIIYYELYDSAANKVRDGSVELGTAEYVESSYQGLSIPHPRITDICTVKVRLRFGNSNVYSEWIEQNIMTALSTDTTTTLLCINNIENPVYNWTSQRLLQYAVYNPTSLVGSKVDFVLKNNEETTDWITSSNGAVQNGIIYDFTPYLSIEYTSASGRVRLFAAKLNISVDNTLMKKITYSIDNTNDFAPTTGANFILMPSSRSNTDSDKEIIHNETSISTESKYIYPTWNNVLFEDDGWYAEGDIKMLRILAGSSVTIPFECYSNTTQTNGLTIEIDFRARNISDEDEAMLKIGKEVNGQFVGLILYPKRGYMFKSANNVDWFQDIEWGENKRTFVALNIAPNLEVNGRRLNVVRLFVNDNIEREFTFASTDRFWDGVSSDGIEIGCSRADIDVFGMRVYKERLLSSTEILNDYIAAQSDIDSKLELIEANNIMRNGVINYDLAKEKYNTLVWTGVYPSKDNPISSTGDLEINIQGDDDHSGTINDMSCKGQGTSSKRYDKWNGSFGFNDDSVFVNRKDVTVGKYYQLTNSSPKATKLVGKINWASSPQAHKMGMCNIVNLLYDTIFDGTSGYEPSGIKRLEGYENTKIAVEEKAFLFFVRENKDSEPVFYGNMTWGSAKGDKLTFGYDKSHPILKNYLMIEGSDQTPPLTLCHVPWFDDEVDYNEEEEYYEYAGTGSFDATLGNRDSIGHFRDAFNKVFELSTRIKYYNGRLDELQLDTNADRSYQYFLVGQTYDNFNLYRYDHIGKKWVNAGITKDENGNYAVVNLNTQLGLSVSTTNADFDAVTEIFKQARIQKFRAEIGSYIHVMDTLFGMQMNKFMAASDNRAKNTYPYYDPVDGVIRWASDDNDTILPFNNQGQKQKPYWVEEHDYDDRSSFDGYYWAASTNALFNTFEDAYPNELRLMMRKIMTAMNNLAVGESTTGIMGFFEKYFFSIQKSFPAVAYNECAKLWYENAKIKYDAGEYTNDTDPITQSLGSQLEAEREWVKQRIVYMASYCMYNDALGGSIEFRQRASATYKLKPAIKMYMYMQLGTSYRYPTGYTVPKRCEAGEEVEIVCEGSDSIQTYIVGAEYLEDLGDLSEVAVTGSVAFSSGKRLKRLQLGVGGGLLSNITGGGSFTTSDDISNIKSQSKFAPSAIVSFPPNVEEINMANLGEQLTSIGSLAGMTKLKELKSEGIGVTNMILPQTNNIETLSLPDLTSLVLRNQTGILTFSYTPTSLKSLVTGNCNVIDQLFIEQWLDTIEENYDNYSLEMDGINWSNYTAEHLVKLAQFGRIILKGTITMDANSITGSQMMIVRRSLGSLIDSGDLVLVYRNIISIQATPAAFTGGLQTSQLQITSLTGDPLTIYFDGELTSEKVTLSNKREEIVNGQMIVTGVLSGVSTDIVQTIVITATDGTVTSQEYPVYVRPIVHITSVSLNGGNGYITEIGQRTITATLSPAGYSDNPSIEWSITSVRDTSKYYIEFDDLYYYVKDFDTNSIIVRLNRSSITGTNSTAIIFNQLMPSHENTNDVIVSCKVYDGSELRASRTIGYIGHAYYEPYALQTFDENEPNYNPVFFLFLSTRKSFKGKNNVLEEIDEDFFNTHKVVNDDGSVGYYITQAEAKIPYSQQDQGIVINGNTIYTDTNGYVYKSYNNGMLNPDSTYSLTNKTLFCYRYFKVLYRVIGENNVPFQNIGKVDEPLQAHTTRMVGIQAIPYHVMRSQYISLNVPTYNSFTTKIILPEYVTYYLGISANSNISGNTKQLFHVYIANNQLIQLHIGMYGTNERVHINYYVRPELLEDYQSTNITTTYGVSTDFYCSFYSYDFDNDPDGVLTEYYDYYR